MLDLKTAAGLIVSEVKGYVERRFATLEERIAALPKEIDHAAVQSLVADQVKAAVAEMPKPQDGKSVDIGELSVAIIEAAAKAVAAIPKPENGKDADPEQIALAVKQAVDAIPRPKDADPVTPEMISPLVKAEVERAVAELPDEQAIVRNVWCQVTKALDELPPPQDGKDGKDIDPEQLKVLVAEQSMAAAEAFADRLAEHLNEAESACV